MARHADAAREKRAKIVRVEGASEAAAALGAVSDVMRDHPLALHLRELRTLIEIGVDKNTTVVLPGPLNSTIQEICAFRSRETGAVRKVTSPLAARPESPDGVQPEGQAVAVEGTLLGTEGTLASNGTH